MKKRILGLLGLAALAIVAGGALRRQNVSTGSVEVREEHVQIWSSYEGTLESRTVRNIMPKMGGSATITELVPEGSTVRKGDVLVRFDSSQFDRDVLRLERDYMSAKSDLEGLTNAKLPLELQDLEMRAIKARSDYSAEKKFLEDSRDLMKEGLIAEAEVKQEEQKVQSLQAEADNMAEQLRLTREYLHPSIVERARTALASAEQEYLLAQRQVSNCTIVAPSDGVVVYKLLSVGSEYRTARVGDSLYKNQPFMALPDMTNLVVHLDVPESELARVRTGQPVAILPRSFPDSKFEGSVESVGSMAQGKFDRPSWQKYFHVVVALSETSDRLRSGMSVLCRVLTHDEPAALVVPRGAVKWDGPEPYCLVARHGRPRKQPVKLGPADDQRFIVREGLTIKDRVVVE